MAKLNTQFMTKMAENHTLWGRTYLYSLYKGVPPRGEHLLDIEKDDKKASKPVARHFNLPIIVSNIWQYAAFPYIKGSTESRKV